MTASLLPETAIAAAYLRRLGYNEVDAAKHISSKPLSNDAPSKAAQALLSELVLKHVLRIPFSNFEQHNVPGIDVPVTSLEARLRRLAQPREAASRLAFGGCGGFCYDINPAFAWLLQILGAKTRLGNAWVAAPNGIDFLPDPTHVVILVDFTDGTYLVDPGFGDAPRTPVALQGQTVSDFGTYEVADNTHEVTKSFSKVLCCPPKTFQLRQMDDDILNTPTPDSVVVYAFRPEDDLQPDSDEFIHGLHIVLTSAGSLFTQKRFICQGIPDGYVVLSERRFRRVEGKSTVEEVVIENEEAWKVQVARLLSFPYLELPLHPKASVSSSPVKRLSAATTNGTTANQGSGQTSWLKGRTQVSQETASSRALNLGTVDSKSIAVGGAGAGGGLGLNKPGFGPKVQHFAGGGGVVKHLDISPQVRSSWLEVMDDMKPLAWIYCTYSEDGKTLELKESGCGGLSEFKNALGDSIAWGGFRCYGVDRRGALECKRPKFVFVQHKPEQTSAIKKARQSSHKGDVKEAITGAHLDVAVESLQDLDEQSLIEKLQAATGAHKPNGYEFDSGIFIEADFYGLGIGKQCKGETSVAT